VAVLSAVRDGDLDPVVRAVDAIAAAFANGQALLVFGNGGSAADAQHFVTEFVGRYERERRAVPALALTADTSLVTAVGNDYGFDRVFARQIEAFGAPGVYIGLATDRSVATRPVHDTQHPVYLGYAMGFYRHIGAPETLRAIQLFWPDESGLFPFDLGCDSHVAHLQPRLELPELRPDERRW